MIKIKLITEHDGGFVTNVLIPPFQTLPKAIMWGHRFFFYETDEVYREGFIVAATMQAPNEIVEKEKPEIKKTKEPVGNDAFLFGLPKNIDEAVETFLEFFRNAKDMASIIDLDEDKFVGAAHFGSAGFLRNSWFLWWYPDHKVPKWPKSKPPLVAYFNNLGIYHADDMTGIIIKSASRKVNNKPIDLEGQVKHYIDFWKKEGFKDGNPSNRSPENLK